MEIKKALPNHNKHKNRLFLVFIHAMNVPFQRKQKKCFKGNWEGRKALTCSVYQSNIVRLPAVHQFSFHIKLQEGSYWLDLAQMN